MSRGLVNKSTGERIPSAPGYIVDKVGDLSALHTTAKDKAVSAINEVADAVSAIDDGTSIDSFADVESALGGKQAAFERISYADWQLLSPQQQAAKPYYIYDYPSTEITAGNVGYSNTQSGMSANKVQGAIDELASGKQPKTDNNLATTSKETTGAINELKSGLTDLNSNIAPLINGLKVAVVPSGTDRKIKITRSYAKQCFFVMTSNNYHPFFGLISQLDGATDHLQSVPAVSGVTVSLTNDTFEFTLISYFGVLTIVSSQDFTVTTEPVT